MANRTRNVNVELSGVRAVKSGAPSVFGDIYYLMMEITWPVFILWVSLIFVGINLAFGAIYACVPGAIDHAKPGSVLDGFFFSVETLATVGYGNMAPATHLGHSIAAVEILLGLFFSATMTGLIFARFARPRDSLVFSRVAVIGPCEQGQALMIRLASTRARPLTDVTAQVSWLEMVTQSDGRSFRRLVELPLVRSRNPILGLSWTLMHVLEPDSPLLTALHGTTPFLLTVSVTGTDTLLASQSQGSYNYPREQILTDHEYIDVISDLDGAIHLNLSRLHDAAPVFHSK